MPKFLENRLRAQAAKEGKTGRAADRYVYGAMNNMGAMHGNQETAKGARMDAKHARDTGRPLHPALAERSRMVKEAHAHLKQAIPGFHKLPPRQQLMATQHHVKLRKGEVT